MFSAPVLHSDYPFRRRVGRRSKKTRREPVMDLTAAFAFLDSDSDDDEAPIPLPFPPLVVPDFFEEDDGESDNLALLFGRAAYC